MKLSTIWPGFVLILIGILLGFWGIKAGNHDWSVSGGPIVWIFYFGGSLIFLGCGIQIVLKSWRFAHNEK